MYLGKPYDQLSDFLPEPTVRVELTFEELDLLLHFAEIGQDKVYQRNNFGDRVVSRQLDPVVIKLKREMLHAFGG